MCKHGSNPKLAATAPRSHPRSGVGGEWPGAQTPAYDRKPGFGSCAGALVREGASGRVHRAAAGALVREVASGRVGQGGCIGLLLVCGLIMRCMHSGRPPDGCPLVGDCRAVCGACHPQSEAVLPGSHPPRGLGHRPPGGPLHAPLSPTAHPSSSADRVRPCALMILVCILCHLILLSPIPSCCGTAMVCRASLSVPSCAASSSPCSMSPHVFLPMFLPVHRMCVHTPMPVHARTCPAPPCARLLDRFDTCWSARGLRRRPRRLPCSRSAATCSAT